MHFPENANSDLHRYSCTDSAVSQISAHGKCITSSALEEQTCKNSKKGWGRDSFRDAFCVVSCSSSSSIKELSAEVIMLVLSLEFYRVSLRLK